MPNWEQIKGIVERLLTIALTYAVARGWIPAGDVTGYVTLALAVLSAIWAWKVNTAPALKEAASNVKK